MELINFYAPARLGFDGAWLGSKTLECICLDAISFKKLMNTIFQYLPIPNKNSHIAFNIYMALVSVLMPFLLPPGPPCTRGAWPAQVHHRGDLRPDKGRIQLPSVTIPRVSVHGEARGKGLAVCIILFRKNSLLQFVFFSSNWYSCSDLIRFFSPFAKQTQAGV